MSAGRTFVDPNVFTYLFDDAEPAKQAKARQRLEAEQRDHELVISTQVLQELYVSLTKGSDPIADPEIAERAVREATGYFTVQVDVVLVLSAIQASRVHQMSFWDSLVICAAKEAGCDRLLTEDMNHGQTVDSVHIENPFA